MIFFQGLLKRKQMKVLQIKVRKASILRDIFVRILDYFKNALSFLEKNLSEIRTLSHMFGKNFLSAKYYPSIKTNSHDLFLE